MVHLGEHLIDGQAPAVERFDDCGFDPSHGCRSADSPPFGLGERLVGRVGEVRGWESVGQPVVVDGACGVFDVRVDAERTVISISGLPCSAAPVVADDAPVAGHASLLRCASDLVAALANPAPDRCTVNAESLGKFPR
jgi:hypothetical protein